MRTFFILIIFVFLTIACDKEGSGSGTEDEPDIIDIENPDTVPAVNNVWTESSTAIRLDITNGWAYSHDPESFQNSAAETSYYYEKKELIPEILSALELVKTVEGNEADCVEDAAYLKLTVFNGEDSITYIDTQNSCHFDQMPVVPTEAIQNVKKLFSSSHKKESVWKNWLHKGFILNQSSSWTDEEKSYQFGFNDLSPQQLDILSSMVEQFPYEFACYNDADGLMINIFITEMKSTFFAHGNACNDTEGKRYVRYEKITELIDLLPDSSSRPVFSEEDISFSFTYNEMKGGDKKVEKNINELSSDVYDILVNIKTVETLRRNYDDMKDDIKATLTITDADDNMRTYYDESVSDSKTSYYEYISMNDMKKLIEVLF